MNRHTLREIAKVGVGVVVADIVCALWLSSAGLLPITVLGISFGESSVLAGLVFDIALLLLLAHYGWNMTLPIKSPTERGLLKLVGSVFLIVALIHLVRVAFGWDFIIGSTSFPLWISWFGVIILGYLSYSSFHFAFKK